MKPLLLVFLAVHAFADSELPIDTKEVVWKKSVDPDSGYTFYFNNVGESQWDAPDSIAIGEIEKVTTTFDARRSTVYFVPESEWTKFVDPKSGKTFYLNAAGETRWVAPGFEWKESVDPASGKIFYYNAAGESTWDVPGSVPESEGKKSFDPASRLAGGYEKFVSKPLIGLMIVAPLFLLLAYLVKTRLFSAVHIPVERLRVKRSMSRKACL